MTTILALPGSLRENSSSNHILKAMIPLAPPGVSIEIFQGIGDLPHFNDPKDAPAKVIDFRRQVAAAKAVLICTPEYAFGVPGSLKNALDWLVGSGELIDKPVGLVTASSQGEKGHAALLLILSAISAKVIPDATILISFVRSRLDETGRIKDPALTKSLMNVVSVISRKVIGEYEHGT